MRFFVHVVWLASVGTATPSWAQSAADAYVTGLLELRESRIDAAIAAFSRAIEAQSEDPAFRIARGAAYLFAEQPERAVADLDRARHLTGQGAEARLWRAAADRMQARFFTEIYPQATNDPFESAVGHASAMWGQHFRAVESGYEPAAEVLAATRARLAELRVWFVEKKLEEGSAVEVLWKRGRELCDRGEWAGAASLIEAAHARWPDDPRVLQYHAGTRLALGDLASARSELTRVLIADVRAVAAYAGRALAAASMGDAERARADLGVLHALDPSSVGTERERVERGLAEAKLDPAFAAPRRRYDERYQDGLRVREERVLASPAAAPPLADLAAWLYAHADVPREKVEPRGAPRAYRYQTQAMQEAELARAEALCDRALAIEPACVKALVVKAAVRMWNLLYADAETLLRRALDQAPTDAEVLNLLARVLDVASAQKRAFAASLRTPTVVGTDTRTEGDYEITTTWWRYPSQAELARARELEAESERCLQRAAEALEHAADSLGGTARGFFLRGVIARRAGDGNATRAAFARAAELDPDDAEARFQLARVCAELGDGAAALAAQAAGTLLLETSAAPHLRAAWQEIERTRFESARALLDAAARCDPADARVPAYRGIALQAEGNLAEAAACFERALAMERERARLAGTSFDAGDARRVPTELLGLELALRAAAAENARLRGEPQAGLAHLEVCIALEPRLRRRQDMEELPRAMLPVPGQEVGFLPEAQPALVHIARARVRASELAFAEQSYAAAKSLVAPVFAYGPRQINGVGSDRFRESELYARVLLCRIALAEGQLEEARTLAQGLPRMRHGAGPSKGAFPDLEKLGQELADEVDRRWREAQERGDETWDAQGVPDPAKASALVRSIAEESGLAELALGDPRQANVAVPFSAALQQAALAIVAPKSNAWREQVRFLVQAAQAEREHTAETLARLEQPRDPRFAQRDDAELYRRLLACEERALALLRTACVKHGYPEADFDRDLASRGGPPGPAPYTGPAEGTEARIAAVCQRVGVPYLRATDRFTAAPESMLVHALRGAVSALEARKTPEWKRGVIEALGPLAVQRRQALARENDIDRRIESTRQRAAQSTRAAAAMERQIAQLEAQREALRATRAPLEKALEVLREEAAKSGYPVEELDADLRAAGFGG